MTQMQDWIRFWFKRDDREFEERAKKVSKDTQRFFEETGIACFSPEVSAKFARWDQELHERNQFPVGVFLDAINPNRHDGEKIDTEMLLMVAGAGKDLLYSVIATADEEGNKEVFLEAYDNWDPVVDAVLEECGQHPRCSFCGSVMPPQQAHSCERGA